MNYKTAVLSRRIFLKTSLLASNVFLQRRSTVAILGRFPKPKFYLGQSVKYQWVCDDEMDEETFGQTLWYIGEIRGIVYAHPEIGRAFCPQWNYFIDWLIGHPRVADDVPHFCPVPYAEEELEAVQI